MRPEITCGMSWWSNNNSAVLHMNTYSHVSIISISVCTRPCTLITERYGTATPQSLILSDHIKRFASASTG